MPLIRLQGYQIILLATHFQNCTQNLAEFSLHCRGYFTGMRIDGTVFRMHWTCSKQCPICS